MDAEVFAEWLKRQGHKIYRTSSSYWYDAGPHVLQAFPYHWLITPDDREIKTLLLNHRILALRFSAPADYYAGKISYHIVLNKDYDLNLLGTKARNGVKCGLKNFMIERISFDRLAGEGWELQHDTLLRQNRERSMTRKEWELLCRSANDLPGFEAFAAISGNELAAAVIVCQVGDVYSVPFAMSHCRFLRRHVNNALFYSVSNELLNREDTKKIFFTVQSLDAPPDVDEFKLRMGFEPKIVRQNVVFHPFLKPFIRTAVYSLNRKLLEHYPENPFFAKSEGMMRFYLEGRRPVKEQNWPVLIKEESRLLDSNALII